MSSGKRPTLRSPAPPSSARERLTTAHVAIRLTLGEAWELAEALVERLRTVADVLEAAEQVADEVDGREGSGCVDAVELPRPARVRRRKSKGGK